MSACHTYSDHCCFLLMTGNCMSCKHPLHGPSLSTENTVLVSWHYVLSSVYISTKTFSQVFFFKATKFIDRVMVPQDFHFITFYPLESSLVETWWRYSTFKSKFLTKAFSKISSQANSQRRQPCGGFTRLPA